MSKEFEEIVLSKLDALENTVQNVVLNKLDILDERTQNTDKELKNMQSDMKALKEDVKKLNDNFTVFDFEINKKIDTLFDAITANNEKHDLFEKSIVSLNTKTFNHDIRISVLEDHNKNAKIFATN